MSQNQAFNKLVRLLKELFQLDQPDLDFGLYRIMHARAEEITRFLDHELLPQVQEAFSKYRTADKAELEKELQEVISGIEKAGMNPEESPKVRELRQKIAEQGVDISGLEREVYDHLYKFFRRYYQDGDFLAKRVYKPGVYAIPYEGEEVKLHWANKDQYYIKTSEYLRDYTFTLKPNAHDDPMRVHFRLIDAAEGEHGNVKANEDQNRVFILARENFIDLENGEDGQELVINFEYRPATLQDWSEDAKAESTAAAIKKPPTQKVLCADAVRRILAVEDERFDPWLEELSQIHIKANKERADYNRLTAHLNRYTARNTFDYFIHKDLGGFLRRELDFYIKNEVMHLDDIESETAPRVEQYLSKIKVIRQIAGKIIDFLAQLEDFQKKLWLKKKFVTETSWCIRVGCIPEEFYPEIVANDAQRQEWVELHAINEIQGDSEVVGYSEPLTTDFLKSHPTLMIDTHHFNEEFTQRLLEAMGDIDEQTDGVLFHSENFQAINALKRKYKDSIQCIYIDPPYNTASSEILYKNSYKHSSWCSLMQDRIMSSKSLLKETGILQVAIDDMEFSNLEKIVKQIYGDNNFIANIAIMHNPKGRDQAHIADCHEYTILAAKDIEKASTGRLKLSEKDLALKYSKSEGERKYRELPLRRSGSGSQRQDRPYMFFPFIYDESTNQLSVIPEKEYEKIYKGSTFNDEYIDRLSKKYQEQGLNFILPIRDDGSYGRWRWGYKSCIKGAKEGILFVKSNNNKKNIYQIDDSEETYLPKSLWYGDKYDASSKGTNLLKNIVISNKFNYPKSLFSVEDLLYVGSDDDDTVIDYFAGSGTTGHAIININRESETAQRKFILVEMGDYFDTVLLPRLKKVIFTPEWQNGKPKRLATKEEAERSPRIMKVVRLESYEDTLNNLAVHRSTTQKSLLDFTKAQGKDRLREQYMLRYLLNVETRGSQSLLNIKEFADPTAYELKVKRPGSEESRVVNVDLLETFNWLIGLTVESIAAQQTVTASFKHDTDPDLPKNAPRRLLLDGRISEDSDGPWWFRTVSGMTSDERKTLVIWRKLTGDPEKDNLVLDEWFKKQGYSSKDSEFDLIYVNGDNNLENLRQPDDTWKVRLIEEDFHRLMFEETEA